MTRNWTLVFLVTLLGIAEASCQQTTQSYGPMPPRWDIGIGYNFIRANAPPTSCQCFTAQGWFAAGDWFFNNWLSASAQFTYDQAYDISFLKQGLTLTTYKAGPKVFWVHNRYTPYAEFLVGGARGANSYFPSGTSATTSATSFASSPGAGIDIRLTDRIVIRALDAEYLHTGFPNGNGTNAQNQLQLQSGFVFTVGNLIHRD